MAILDSIAIAGLDQVLQAAAMEVVAGLAA